MTTKFKKPGDIWDYPNATGADIPVNSVVVVGDLIGVALVTIKNGETGSVGMCGIYALPKVTGAAWVQGKKLLFDKSAGKFDVGTATPAAGDVSGCCVAAAAAASADATGWVQINMGIGTVT